MSIFNFPTLNRGMGTIYILFSSNFYHKEKQCEYNDKWELTKMLPCWEDNKKYREIWIWYHVAITAKSYYTIQFFKRSQTSLFFFQIEATDF